MKYIFEVHIHPGYSADEYADAWLRASALIQQAPGALGTELHRSLDDPSHLIAIARWSSKKARDAMESNPDEAVAQIIKSVAHLCSIQPVGEFAEPEWAVIPNKTAPHGDSE